MKHDETEVVVMLYKQLLEKVSWEVNYESQLDFCTFSVAGIYLPARNEDRVWGADDNGEKHVPHGLHSDNRNDLSLIILEVSAQGLLVFVKMTMVSSTQIW